MSFQSLHRTTYNAVLGRLLVRYRNELNLDQKQMANILGMSQSGWSRIETGESSVTVTQLGLIAQLLKRPPQDILAEVEKARMGLEDIGVEVIMDKPNNSDVIFALLAGAALGVLIAKIMSSK